MNPASTRLSSTTLARARGPRGGEGREFARRFKQARQHRGFRQRHVADRFAEIVLCGATDAESAAAKVGAVQIEFENLFFGEAAFQPQGEERFVDLAFDGSLVRKEQVLGKLLRNRRAALYHAAGPGIGRERPRGAVKVDAVMLVETPILGGQRRLNEMVGHLFERNRIIVLDAAVADLIAVTV